MFIPKWQDIHKTFWTIWRYSTKMFEYFHIVYYSCTLKALPCKSWFYFFFFVFCHAKISPSFRMHASCINCSLIFFKCFSFFKFIMPSKNSDMNNSIRTIFIKIIIIIKTNFIKIYSKNMSLESNKCDFIKSVL